MFRNQISDHTCKTLQYVPNLNSIFVCLCPNSAQKLFRGSKKIKLLFSVDYYFFFTFQENYVPLNEKSLSNQRPMFDTILCLSVTKWVHLNWGDQGIKLMFKKIYRNLRPGGRLILEPQPFASYSKRKKLTVRRKTYFTSYTVVLRGIP